MGIRRDVKKVADQTAWNPLGFVRGWGVRSSHAYTLGLIALALSCLSWMFRKGEGKVRGGLHLGGLATAMIALGNGLKHEE